MSTPLTSDAETQQLPATPTPDYPERRGVQLSPEQISEGERLARVWRSLEGPASTETTATEATTEATTEADDSQVEAQAEEGTEQSTEASQVEAQAPATEPEPAPAPATENPAAAQLTEALDRLATMQAEIAAREAQVAERAARIERFERFAEKAESEDFLGALEEMGWDFDSISKAAVTGSGLKGKAAPKPDSEIERLREEMKAELEAIRAERQTAQETRTRAAVAAVISPDATPALHALGDDGIEAVINHVKQSYTNSGKELNAQQAVEEAEKELASFLTRFAQADSVRSKYFAATAAPAPISEPPATSESKPALSNRTASSVAKRGSETLTDEVRLERAYRILGLD